MKKLAALAAAFALACAFCTAAFARDVTIRTTVPERPAATAAPGDDHPEIADAIQNGTWGRPAATPAIPNNAAGGGTAANTAVPKTADSFDLAFWLALASVSAAGAGTLLVLRRRADHDRQ